MSDIHDWGTIEWTRPMLHRFKKRFMEAVNKEEDQFEFDGHEFLTKYAKYLIEYLNTRFFPLEKVKGWSENE